MTREEIGTLFDLDVKPGDVVTPYGECHSWWTEGKEYLIHSDGSIIDDDWHPWGQHNVRLLEGDFRIVSRAFDPTRCAMFPRTKQISQDDKPRTWGEMTPEEKGALLLAAHEGKAVEVYFKGGWIGKGHGGFGNAIAYRVRPEPKRETVTLYGGFRLLSGAWGFSWSKARSGASHRTTFDLIDGEPDCASIKMERLP